MKYSGVSDLAKSNLGILTLALRAQLVADYIYNNNKYKNNKKNANFLSLKSIFQVLIFWPIAIDLAVLKKKLAHDFYIFTVRKSFRKTIMNF
ncbi:hypothetical protein BpHYR1_013970 [Brachionus plicatilis]|uniref:Uncharacterized protein n=1 Tax=Brachionus plicatilis TaxID=10195 RepID=A0A3M7SSM7_BRAPC|nr:hypothetical protein BpHYR1_013970 [Brachionus plicatilis]